MVLESLATTTTSQGPSGYTRVFGIWSCMLYLGGICNAGLHGAMSGLLAGSLQLAPWLCWPPACTIWSQAPVVPSWPLCSAGSSHRSLEHVKGKSPGGRYVLREPLGLRVGDLWESWSCAAPYLELLPPSLKTPYTDRTFKQTPGTVLSLKIPWCHP